MIKNMIYMSFLFLIMNVAIASSFHCVGMTATGYEVNVLGDLDSQTININGDIHKIVSTTIDKTGVVTENFINENGILVYFSLAKDDSTGDPILLEFNAVTNRLTGVMHLACHKNPGI